MDPMRFCPSGSWYRIPLLEERGLRIITETPPGPEGSNGNVDQGCWRGSGAEVK